MITFSRYQTELSLELKGACFFEGGGGGGKGRAPSAPSTPPPPPPAPPVEEATFKAGPEEDEAIKKLRAVKRGTDQFKVDLPKTVTVGLQTGS